MNIHAHILNYNEERMLPYTLRHYTTFCSRVIVHDLGSHDRSHDIAKEFGARIVQHDTHDKFDDLLNARIKSNTAHDRDADWVIAADCDELIYFPLGPKFCFETYQKHYMAVIKPQGYDMVADKFPTTTGQIYDEVKMGAREDLWYSKPIIFRPRLLKALKFGVGCHEVVVREPGAHEDRLIGPKDPVSNPVCYLLHFHHIDSVEEIAKKYDRTKARYSENNRKYSWGWQGDGMEHALAKRQGILDKLERVVE